MGSTAHLRWQKMESMNTKRKKSKLYNMKKRGKKMDEK
jgi:hypothetical protein